MCIINYGPGIATGYGLDGRGSIPGKGQIFLFSVAFRPALGELCLLPVSCWFLAWHTLQYLRWKRYVRNVSWLSPDYTPLYPRRQSPL
jgi:hypothetical protein